MIGDLCESFIKRRLGKQPSQSWKGADQIDFVIGSLIFISFIKILSLKDYLSIIIISFILTIIVNQIGWKIGLRKERW